jgi:hypothetical protein
LNHSELYDEHGKTQCRVVSAASVLRCEVDAANGALTQEATVQCSAPLMQISRRQLFSEDDRSIMTCFYNLSTLLTCCRAGLMTDSFAMRAPSIREVRTDCRDTCSSVGRRFYKMHAHARCCHAHQSRSIASALRAGRRRVDTLVDAPLAPIRRRPLRDCVEAAQCSVADVMNTVSALKMLDDTMSTDDAMRVIAALDAERRVDGVRRYTPQSESTVAHLRPARPM